MLRIIRAGTNYEVIVAITPADATPETEGVRCFQKKSWDTESRFADIFYEISVREALNAFCGLADGWGFAEIPDITFPTLGDIDIWVAAEQLKNK